MFFLLLSFLVSAISDNGYVKPSISKDSSEGGGGSDIVTPNFYGVNVSYQGNKHFFY